ncbi:MAG TPA: thioredoxin family protein [Anaerolineales bacterium]|nr:thioredoxin family protein [Anaerolineales bacterium]
MLERLILAVGLTLLGLLAYRLYRRFQLSRGATAILGVEGYRLGKPAILYFTAPGCGPCLAVQRPALSELAAQFGPRLQILEVDALTRPNLADSWGVLSLPTTFIIDSVGRPRRVNHGATRAPRLRDQLAGIGEHAPEGSRAADPANEALS